MRRILSASFICCLIIFSSCNSDTPQEQNKVTQASANESGTGQSGVKDDQSQKNVVQLPQTELLSTIFQFSTPNVPNWPILGILYRKHADNSFDFDAGFSNVDASPNPHVSYADLFKEPALWIR